MYISNLVPCAYRTLPAQIAGRELLDQKLKRAEVVALSAIKDEVSEVIFEAINKSITSNNIKPSSYDKILQDGIKQIRK